nr:ATP-binding domain-containing protein [Myxococcota bacterium]
PEVTALLDAEQHAAIAAPADRGLLVIGSAGSGKTTVALHRLARLHARDPLRVPLERTRVIVPEVGLAKLSRRLLGPLGMPDAQVSTLDDWALELARRTFGGVPRIGDETPAIVVRLKRHPALYDGLRARLAKLPPHRAQTIPRLRRVLGDLLSDRAFLASVIDASDGDLPRYAAEETVRHTMRQLDDASERHLASITDPSAKRAIDGRSVSADTPEATGGSIDVEDLPIFLFVRAWRAGLDAPRIAHLVIDEAEDFSLFELHVLGALLDPTRSVTLAGDDAQRTGTGFAGWARALEVLGVRGASECRLSVSYRCPQPIVTLAQTILGREAPDAPAKAARGGAPIARDAFQGEPHAMLVLADALRDLLDREPRAAIAVIAESADTAHRVHAALADLPRTRLVIDGDFGFDPGLDVTCVDAVKGLEFDYVVVPDLTASAYPDEPEARRRLHVAVTRAAYQVWLITPGTASPIDL